MPEDHKNRANEPHSEHTYIEVYINCSNADIIKDVLWAHSAIIQLLHVFFSDLNIGLHI